MKEVMILWIGIVLGVGVSVVLHQKTSSMPKYEYMLDVNSEDSVTVYNPRTGKSVKVELGASAIKEVVLKDNI